MTFTPARSVRHADLKRQTMLLLKDINANGFHLRDQLLKADELDELDVLNEYLRHVLLRLEESCAEGRLLR